MNRMIEWFTDNHVAANLLMILIIVAGFMSAMSIRQEVFPQVDLDLVSVQVLYLGASPEEVEEGVCLRVEEAIQGIDGIKRINATAVENSGTVTAEISTDADARVVLDEIKQAVDRIITFPDETEKPVINLMESSEQAIDVVIFGDANERTLKELADRVRDDLLAMENITQVQLVGTRPYEISVEVSEADLRRHGLSFSQITAAVRSGSLDLPGGSVKTDAGEILIRTKGQRYTGREFEDIVVLSRPDGTRLTLGQIATVKDTFEDVDSRSRFDGQPAAVVSVFRVADQAILEVTSLVKEYVAEHEGTLPDGVEMAVWADRSEIYRGRMNLMLKNGTLGLLLVFGCLALFLQPRLAFWVALGIPISFMGGFWLIPGWGASLNMISMFAFIVVLGMVVDDAIVVGENIYHFRQRGFSRREGAIRGTKEVALPVLVAVTTTIFAFMPLANVEGMMGNFMGQVPMVVIAVLLVSLVESLWILPAHLSTIPAESIKGTEGGRGLLALQAKFARGFEFFIERTYKPALAFAVNHRAVVLAMAIASIALMVGYVGGGHVRFTFMPKVDADNMICVINMPPGVPVVETERAVAQALAGLEKLEAEVMGERPEDAQNIFLHSFATVGSQPRGGAGGGRPGSESSTQFGGAHIAEINVELMGSEDRGIAGNELVKRWRKLTGPIAGVNSVTFTSNLFHGSSALELQLSSEDTDILTAAAERLKLALADYPGVQDIDDSYQEGKQELKLSLLPAARTLGLTLRDLASQVRQGFYGDEALRLQRGRDDVRVMVRYPKEERTSIGDLELMRVRTPEGAEVPFSSVAKVDGGRGYASISRQDRRRVVSVIADVDQNVTNAQEVLADLQQDVIPALIADYPTLHLSFEGEERDRKESMDSLKGGFLIALLAIYALLAVLFKSYAQPIIIMSAIPFGLLGAVLGHVAMGLDLTLLSLFGVVALTGVVVNDSLIMVDFINRTRAEGHGMREAVLISGVRRFRPIVLTSLTTFAGLTPMLLEKSMQAKFLIPMAVSLGFGVLFATVITLILVPVSYLILEDLKRGLGMTKKIEGEQSGSEAQPAIR